MNQLQASVDAFARAQKSIGGGVGSGLRAAMRPHPISFRSGAGSHLIDVDGIDRIDYVGGFGPMLIGHSHPAVAEAVARQAHEGQLYGAGHHLEYEVAELLLDTVPGYDKLLWSNTGTEAVQVALRLARAATGRRKVLKFAGTYHGWHDTVLISYRSLTDERAAVPNSRGMNEHVLDDVVVVPFGDLATLEAVLAEQGADIAAVLVESELTNSGLASWPAGGLARIAELCHAAGSLFVLDEVITGFRTALGGAVQRHDVRPDLGVYAKALASGYSISAVLGRAELIDQVTQGVVHAGTYNSNAIALAAARSTLNVLRDASTYERLSATTHMLADGLRRVFDARGIAAEVRSLDGIVQVLPGADPDSGPAEFERLDWAMWDCWSDALVTERLHLLPTGRLFVSTEHTAADVTATLSAFDRVLS